MENEIVSLESHKSHVSIFIWTTQILSIFIFPIIAFAIYVISSYLIKFIYFKIINKRIKNIIIEKFKESKTYKDLEEKLKNIGKNESNS
jgi:phosphate/sulfate permease